jgi:hypothetical protein
MQVLSLVLLRPVTARDDTTSDQDKEGRQLELQRMCQACAVMTVSNDGHG